jgi:hypothetical protein
MPLGDQVNKLCDFLVRLTQIFSCSLLCHLDCFTCKIATFLPHIFVKEAEHSPVDSVLIA